MIDAIRALIVGLVFTPCFIKRDSQVDNPRALVLGAPESGGSAGLGRASIATYLSFALVYRRRVHTTHKTRR